MTITSRCLIKTKIVGSIVLCVSLALGRTVCGGNYYAQAEVDGAVADPGDGVFRQTFGFDTGEQGGLFTEFADTGQISNALGTSAAAGEGTALAGPGHVSVYAQAESLISGIGNGNAHVNALAELFDNLTFTGPAATPGQTFHIGVHWNVTGSMNGHANNPTPFESFNDATSTEANATLQVWGSAFGIGHGSQSGSILVASADYTINSAQNIGVTNPVNSEISVSIDVVSGQPFEFSAALEADADSLTGTSDRIKSQNADSGITADFSHTIAWGGIDSVTDTNGNPIVGWSVSSDSGFDYSKPYAVPEPSMLTLLGMAVLAIPATRRRWLIRR